VYRLELWAGHHITLVLHLYDTKYINIQVSSTGGASEAFRDAMIAAQTSEDRPDFLTKAIVTV
jgi:hypothetical protein